MQGKVTVYTVFIVNTVNTSIVVSLKIEVTVFRE